MDDSQLLPSRYYALAVAVMIGVIAGAASLVEPRWLLVAVPAGALCAVGFYDLAQTRHSIRRNYPILAHFRFFFEMIPPGDPPILGRVGYRCGAVLADAAFVGLPARQERPLGRTASSLRRSFPSLCRERKRAKRWRSQSMSIRAPTPRSSSSRS